MKKMLFIVLFATLSTLSGLPALADDKTDVMEIFNKYVNDSNAYSQNIINYYTDNAKIIRVVNKKGGGKKAVLIPFDRYVKELQSHSKLAKVTGYKNRYENRKISKINNDYKISATRYPRNDKTGLSAYFIFTKENNTWKIKEESMTTNVQTFLSAN